MVNKSLVNIVLLGVGIALLQGCSETASTNGGGPNLKAIDEANRIGGTVYFTGIDDSTGFDKNDFSIFITTRRTVTVLDPTIATAVRSNITIDQATVADQIAQFQAAYDQAGEVWSQRSKDRWTRRFTNPSITKITPLKAGITAIKAEREGRTENVWEDAEIRTLVVNKYTAAQVEMGKQRYTTGNQIDVACTSCHGGDFNTASASAPPHLLGRVIDIDDAHVAQWITEGRTFDRQVLQQYGTQHQWQFNSPAEEAATVAYLRSKQTPSEQDFAKLLFEEELFETKVELGLLQGTIDL